MSNIMAFNSTAEYNAVQRRMREDAEYIIETINWEYELDSFDKSKKLSEILAEAFLASTSRKYHSYETWSRLGLEDYHAYAVLGDDIRYSQRCPTINHNEG